METKRIFLKSICLLLFTFYGLNISFAQIQAPSIEKSEAYCQYCLAKWPAPHKTDCRYYKKSQTNKPDASAGAKSTSLEQQIIMQIFAGMVQNTLNSNNGQKKQQTEAEKQKLLQEEKFKQQRMVALLTRQKKYNDSIAQAKHDKMMKEYKPLEGNEDVAFKKIDDAKPIINFNCKITSFKGKVIIVKPNGKMIVLNEDSPINAPIDLAPGDIIATAFNSRVKLHYAFEKGGHDVLLGQKTAIRIVEAEDGTQEPVLYNERGNMYVTNNIVSEKIAETKEEIITEAEKQLGKLRRKMQIRVPGGTAAVRGTEFAISVDALGNSQVLVLDGIVDVKGNLYDNTVTLTAGYLGVVNDNGEIIGVYKFEIDRLEKWWIE